MLDFQKKYLLIFLSCLAGFFELLAQNTSIPPTVLPFLEKAEYYRANSQMDSCLSAFRNAKKAYYALGRSAEAVDLGARVLMAIDQTAEETPLHRDTILEIQKKYTKDIYEGYPKEKYKDMYKKYYLGVYYLTKNPKYGDSLIALLDTNKLGKDWDYLFSYYSCKSYTEKYYNGDFKKGALYNQKAIEVITDKVLDFRTDYLYKFYINDYVFVFLEFGERVLINKDLELAIKSHEKVLTFLENSPFADSIWLATTFNGIAQIYYEKEDYYKGLSFLEKAQLFVPKPLESDYGFDINLASIAFEIEDYRASIKYAKKCLSKQALIVNKHAADTSDVLLANVYLLMSYTALQQSENAQKQADVLDKLAIVYNIRNHRKGAYYLMAKGLFFYEQGKFTEAEAVFSQAIKGLSGDQLKKNGNRLHTLLARTYFKLGKYAQALEICKKTVNNKADKYTIKCVAVLLNTQEAIGLNSLENINKYKKYADFGISLLNESLKNIEREGSQNSILKLSYPIYEHAINAAYHLHQLTGKQAYLDTAFKYMEDSKSILLSQTLAEKQAQGFAGVDAKLIEMERTLTKDIQFYTQQARDAKTRKDEAAERLYQGYIFDFGLRLDSLKKRLNQEYPSYYALKYQIPPIAIAAVQKQLNDSSLFIEYFEGQEVYFAIGISQNARKFVKIPIGKAEKELIHLFNNAVQSHQIKKSPQELQEMGNRIYKLLLDSLLSDTKIFINAGKIQRLVLIPDGKLNYLPFEALVSNPLPSAEKPTFARLPYLVYQYAHNYQYSARLWLQMASKKPQTIARILGFAAYYPDQDSLQLAKLTLQAQRIRKNLNPLKGALQEVAHLRANYAGNYYSEASATEKQLRQSLQSTEKYQILHLAMHGLVNEETPEWSCLGFSPSADSLEDDLLQAHEIKALQMNQGEGVDMVVLSACETGLGKYQHGEGVISLGRGFVYGGANSLVMSLWSVNDDASAFLMEKFYEHLAAGMEKDAALRQAKLDYLQAAQGQDLACHPALWAAFIQLGNIQPLSIETSRKYLPLRVYALLGLGLSLVGLGYWRWRKYRLQAAS